MFLAELTNQTLKNILHCTTQKLSRSLYVQCVMTNDYNMLKREYNCGNFKIILRFSHFPINFSSEHII